MDLKISELQFAFTFFAKFNEYHNYSFQKIIVPSTLSEGSATYKYNGTDLVLDQYFLQFKLSNLLKSKSSKHYPLFNSPYFEFKIKHIPTQNNTKSQLDFLIEHAKDPHKKVLYVVPSFDLTKYTVNNWYEGFYKSKDKDFFDFTSYVNISSIDETWINKTATSEIHHICFQRGTSKGYFFSEPKEIEMQSGFEKARPNPDAQFNPNFRYNSISYEIERIIESIPISVSEEIEINSIVLNATDPIRELQKILIEKMNIFWIPILKSADTIS